MKCENCYCIYQEDGECLLREITLDITGLCESCIYLNLDEDETNRLKIAARIRLENDD